MEREPILYTNHHIWFERRSFKTPIERRVRNMGAFIIKANAVDHNELHANVLPPPKPSTEQLHDLYNFMQQQNYEMRGTEGLEWGIVWANDRKLYDIEDNLIQQLHYISGDYKNGTTTKA